MVHPLSVAKLRDVLLHTHHWKVVCSLFTSDIAPQVDDAYATWLEKHSHAHPGIEVLIALDGAASVGLLGRVYPVTAGAVIIFGPNEPHSLGYPANAWQRFTHLWIEAFPDHHKVGFSIRIGRRYADTSQINVMLKTDQTHFPLDGYLSEVFRERSKEQAILRTRVVGAVSLVAAAVAERCETPTVANTQAFQRDVIEAVTEHIRVTCGAHVALSDLARISGYSMYYLSRMFREQTGRTIHEYIDLCRQAKAKELSDAGQSRTRIADALGFSCLRSFIAWEKHQKKMHRTVLDGATGERSNRKV